MPPLATSLLKSATTVAALGGTATTFAALDGGQLAGAARAIADLRRHVDQFAALAAGEIAHRSRRELGHQGFAQAAGFVSPVAMIQSVAQVSKHEAARQVETGTLLAEVEATAQPGFTGAVIPRWQTLLASAITEGRLSLEKVDAIRGVMADLVIGDDAAVHGAALDDATIAATVGDLIDAASGSSPEQVFRAARQARDLLDADGIERREKKQRDLRSVRTWSDRSGMFCGSWRLAAEDGALMAEAFQQILSPRRGGPRFVDPAARASAEDLIDDVRSDEQIAADALCDMVRLAVDADPGTLFGGRRPAVRVIVTADRLEHADGHAHDHGHGHLEGHIDAISMPTIDRHLCNTGIITIGFDTDGQCVNVGRDQRLFTERQRIGLSIRDGGCRFPGCERPPSYCEAHHINPWAAKGGRTDVADGILLCRRHHLLIHNNAWEVTRVNAEYHLIPPRTIDPTQSALAMPSRSPIDRDLRRTTDENAGLRVRPDITSGIQSDTPSGIQPATQPGTPSGNQPGAQPGTPSGTQPGIPAVIRSDIHRERQRA